MRACIATPDLATEITLQPTRRYDVDAAILFSDIVTPLEALGIGLEIERGVGPVIAQPFRAAADLDRLRPLEPSEDYDHVVQTVRQLVAELDVPLIGFAGAPFTLASYLVEGGPSKTYATTKAMMVSEPGLFRDLLERLADVAIAALSAQIGAGVHAVQLFDSWAGALGPSDYAQHVLPVSRRIFAAVHELGVPALHFGVATGELLGLMAQAGPDVVGVDWRVPLDVARTRVPAGIGLQGNLDPTHVLAPWETVAHRVRDVLARSGGHPHYVFNLGHGVLPPTDPAILRRVVDLVHAEGRVVDPATPAGGARA
jgi:uroporphyrinogen decarboxylase